MQRILLLVLVAVVCFPSLLEAGRNGGSRQRTERPKTPKDCSPWSGAECIPKNNATCGEGTKLKTRTGDNCPVKEKTVKCRVPCREPARCNYRKSKWSACDPATQMKTRTLTLKPRQPADCQPVQTATKRCGMAARRTTRAPRTTRGE